MKRILLNLALVTTIGLVGCSSNTQSQNTAIGGVTGAVVGGLAGNAIGGGGAGIGIGAVLGAIAGGVIGHNMDSSDAGQSTTAMNSNQMNQTSSWTNPHTGVTYTMTPTSNFFMVKGNPNCRRFHFTATKPNGKMHAYNGTVCRMANGNWYRVR